LFVVWNTKIESPLNREIRDSAKPIYLRCGNTSNQRLREIFGVHLQNAIQQLSDGETVIEIE